MLEIVQKFIGIMWLFIGICVVSGGIVIAIIYSVLKKANKASSEEDKSGSEINRKDIASYVMFDDIRDGIIILNHYTTFVAAIEVQGIDLYHAPADEQTAIMFRYAQLLDMLQDNDYLQARHSPYIRDFESYVDEYTKEYEQVSEKIYQKAETQALLQTRLMKLKKEGFEGLAEYDLYLDKINTITKDIISLSSQKNELDQMIRYIRSVSGPDSDPDTYSSYAFAWHYDKMEHPFEEELSKDELLAKAKRELTSMANSYITAFSECRLHAKQITKTESMVDVFRRYFRPVTGELFKVDQILQGSILDYVTDSETDITKVPKRNSYEAARLAEAHSRILKDEKEGTTCTR